MIIGIHENLISVFMILNDVPDKAACLYKNADNENAIRRNTSGNWLQSSELGEIFSVYDCIALFSFLSP